MEEPSQDFPANGPTNPKVKYFVGPKRFQAVPRGPHESAAIWVKFRYIVDPEEEPRGPNWHPLPFFCTPDPIKEMKKNGGYRCESLRCTMSKSLTTKMAYGYLEFTKQNLLLVEEDLDKNVLGISKKVLKDDRIELRLLKIECYRQNKTWVGRKGYVLDWLLALLKRTG